MKWMKQFKPSLPQNPEKPMQTQTQTHSETKEDGGGDTPLDKLQACRTALRGIGVSGKTFDLAKIALQRELEPTVKRADGSGDFDKLWTLVGERVASAVTKGLEDIAAKGEEQ